MVWTNMHSLSLISPLINMEQADEKPQTLASPREMKVLEHAPNILAIWGLPEGLVSISHVSEYRQNPAHSVFLRDMENKRGLRS